MKTVFAFLYTLIWPFFNLVHPCRVVGREHIPQGAAVVCPNHTALSDPLFVVFAFRLAHRMRIMAKAELLRVPVIGWLLGKAGIFGVERGKSDIKAIKQALRLLKNGEKLLMFPEGTRVKTEGAGEAKTGAAMLAVRTGAPLLPVYVPRKKKWFRRTEVIVGVPYHPEIAGERPTADDYQRIADELLARIRQLGEKVEQ